MFSLHQDNSESERWFYFVDEDRYTYDQATITGAIVKARISGFNPSYSLFQESQENEPDVLVTDDMTFNLDAHKDGLRFYTVPPASFGR